MTTIKQIVEADLCTGCGVCVSENPGNLRMEWDDYGFLKPRSVGEDTGKAIKVCPFNPNPESAVSDEDVLADQFLTTSRQRHSLIGKYVDTYVGYARDFRQTSSSGGIASFVFEQLLRTKAVERLYIVKEISGTYQYQWFSDVGDIRKISKTRYIPVTLDKLFAEIDEQPGKVAVSGVACFLKAIRLKQHYYPEYKEKISFLIGIICGGLKSRFFTDYLAQRAGIESAYTNQEYRIKDNAKFALDYSFGAYDDEGNMRTVAMNTLGDMWGTGLFKSNACDFCDDVASELADISLGDAWISPYKDEPLGNSIIVTRSIAADSIIRSAIKEGKLLLETLPMGKLVASQDGSFKHRQKATKYRLNIQKKTKGIIPKKRKRLLQNIPFEFKIVQRKRMELRQMSLDCWKDYKNATLFDEKITPMRAKLRSLTTFYHRVQKLRGIFRMKRL